MTDTKLPRYTPTDAAPKFLKKLTLFIHMFREDLELTLNMCSRQKESYVCLFKKERWIVTHVWAQDNGSHAQSASILECNFK